MAPNIAVACDADIAAAIAGGIDAAIVNAIAACDAATAQTNANKCGNTDDTDDTTNTDTDRTDNACKTNKPDNTQQKPHRQADCCCFFCEGKGQDWPKMA
jgi:cobalamin-dependent methionine synthase I